MIANLRILRRSRRQLINLPFLFFGFSLVRARPFEVAIRRLEHLQDEIYLVFSHVHGLVF